MGDFVQQEPGAGEGHVLISPPKGQKGYLPPIGNSLTVLF